MSPAPIRILGIDPGLNRTGYGVVEIAGNRLTPLMAGVIRVPPGELHQRLGAILTLLAVDPNVTAIVEGVIMVCVVMFGAFIVMRGRSQ